MSSWKERLYGYNLRHITPTSYKLTVYGKRHSSIAILSTRGVKDFDTYEGNIRSDIFCSFIERCLTSVLQSFNVIILEKRDHFVVKLFNQYEQIKVDTQLGFVHNSKCLN